MPPRAHDHLHVHLSDATHNWPHAALPQHLLEVAAAGRHAANPCQKVSPERDVVNAAGGKGEDAPVGPTRLAGSACMPGHV